VNQYTLDRYLDDHIDSRDECNELNLGIQNAVLVVNQSAAKQRNHARTCIPSGPALATVPYSPVQPRQNYNYSRFSSNPPSSPLPPPSLRKALPLLTPGLGALPPLALGGGVPLLLVGGVGTVTDIGDTPLFHPILQLLPLCSLCFSSLRRSKAALYRSYPSLNDLSTLEENINSPRGLEERGIVAITVFVD
jgi:hypothetical protein